MGLAGHISYASSKGAVDAMTRVSALELGPGRDRRAVHRDHAAPPLGHRGGLCCADRVFAVRRGGDDLGSDLANRRRVRRGIEQRPRNDGAQTVNELRVHATIINGSEHVLSVPVPFLRYKRQVHGEYWHCRHYGNQGGTPGARVRDGDWKLKKFYEDGHEELYNLKEDIGKAKNLGDAEPEDRAELSANVTTWSEEIEGLGVPSIPEPIPDYQSWPRREPAGHFGE